MLNAYQQRAVTIDGHTLITACPGSGKTTVLASRAAHKLTSFDGKLLAVTFTKDSARELKERIIHKAGDSYRKRIIAGTFHSLALRQLRNVFGDESIRLIEEHEKRALILRIAKGVGYAGTMETLLQEVDAAKSTLSPVCKTPDIQAVYEQYQKTLEIEGAMDFSDILIQSVLLMRSGKVSPYDVKFLLADEAQDMDEVQYEWIKCHTKAGAEATLVGDDDQSIYAFRSASGYEGMMNFKAHYRATLIELPINYRSSSKILNPAIRLIEENLNRVHKNIQAGNTSNGLVDVHRFASRHDEAYAIGTAIQNDMNSQWAILGRTNRVLDKVEATLQSLKVPYHRIGGRSFWEQKVVATFLGLLRAIVDENWIGVASALDWAGVQHNIVDMIRTEPMDRWVSLAKTNNDEQGSDILNSFTKMWLQWKSMNDMRRYNLVISSVALWMKKYANDYHSDLVNWAEEAFNKQQGDIIQRFNQVKQQSNTASGGVPLMTMHTSKGLEFEKVWICAAENGTVPSYDSPIDEERRLFYVAMTRAKIELHISWAFIDGKKTLSESQFISEAGLSKNW